MTRYFCAACTWTGENPHVVVERMRAVRDECPRCAGEVQEGAQCTNCGLARAFVGFDECLPCAVAIYIVEDRADLAAFIKRHAGKPWLPEFRREVERQLGALVDCGRAVA